MKSFYMLTALALLLTAWQTNAATVSGTVLFEGKPPVPPIIDTRGKDKHCMEFSAKNPIRADGAAIGPKGEFQWIFVWIDNPPVKEYVPPAEPAYLSQKGCRYEQPVIGFMAGQPIEIHNLDETTHNVRGFPENNKTFNMGQPPGLPPRTRVFENPEKPLKIKCDVHGWMLSYAFVMDHPYFAVTDEKGVFSIPDLPEGTYTVKTWHEKLGEREQEVKVGKDDVSGLSFTYARPKKK